MADLERAKQAAQDAVDEAQRLVDRAAVEGGRAPAAGAAAPSHARRSSSRAPSTAAVDDVLTTLLATLPGDDRGRGRGRARQPAAGAARRDRRAWSRSPPQLPPLVREQLLAPRRGAPPGRGCRRPDRGRRSGSSTAWRPASVQAQFRYEWRPKLQVWPPAARRTRCSSCPSAASCSPSTAGRGKDEMRRRGPRRAQGLRAQPAARRAARALQVRPPLVPRRASSGKPEVDVVLSDIEFLGILGFVETLQELIPFDGFSDPPFLDVTPDGLTAGFTLALPNVSVGVFNLSNMSLGADVQVPFLGKSVTVGFNFCTRERPFTLAVLFIGGGGWFLHPPLARRPRRPRARARGGRDPRGRLRRRLGLDLGDDRHLHAAGGRRGLAHRLLPPAGRGRRARPDLGVDRALPRAHLRVRHRQDDRPGAAHDQGRGVLLLDLGDDHVPSAGSPARTATRASPR